MSGFVVVGSGPSGIHAAQTLLERGAAVTMIDVGHPRPEPVMPGASFHDLKRQLGDPVSWFLGAGFEGVTFPSAEQEYYGLPPSKSHVLKAYGPGSPKTAGFAPLFSYAQGGLAEAWTAGVYPFNDAELADFPFSYTELKPFYERVAARIGITGSEDDLARFMPFHDGIGPPLRLDVHSRLLLERYESRRAKLNEAGCYGGRSRLAVLTSPRDGRGPCTYTGRCLWGCPQEALYTPSVSLRRLLSEPLFTYRPATWVSHLEVDSGRRITRLWASSEGRALEAIPAGAVILAAGALSSARIVLETVRRHNGGAPALPGLMDNQQILMPFLNLGMTGKASDRDAYQYHQVCLGLTSSDPRHYIHAQLTTLKSAMVHPVIQSLPLDLRSAAGVFRTLRGGLGVANVNLHDTRRTDCTASLSADGDGPAVLELHYAPSASDREETAAAARRVRAALSALGCVVPPGMSYIRPKGASVHYAGLIPMKGEAPLTAAATGESRDYPGLWLADGITFPFLPAKNITFTLMANAVRVAENAAAGR